MKCRVCGQPPTGADDLCGDCARALKRAREGAAAVRNAPAPDARKSRARGVNKIILASPLAMPLAVPPRRRLALWGLLVASAILLSYTASRGVEYSRASVAKVAPQPARPPIALMIEPEMDADADEPAARPVHAKGRDSPAHVTSTSALPPAAGRSGRVQGTAMSGTGAQSSADVGVSDAAKSAASSGQGSDAALQLAKANVAASGPSGDDGQSLATALERCSGEKFLAGVICEQKVRLRYCEGKWGQVPQCTPKARVD